MGDEGDQGYQPAGQKHAELLRAFLATRFRIPYEGLYNDSEHERWDFECRVGDTRISCSVLADWNDGGFDAGNWEVDLIPLGLFKFLRRKQIGDAFQAIAKAASEWIDTNSHLSGFHQYDEEQFQKREKKLVEDWKNRRQ